MAKERTEKTIMDAFLTLLNQYPLDKICVKDIVSACGISRNTFYYHYQDIYDLLRATFASIVYRSAYREDLERSLYRVSEERMDRLIRHLTAGMDVPEEDIHYLTLFYKCAVTGILLEWLNADMRGDVDRAISRMGVLLEGSLRQSLERIENKEP